MALSIVNQSSLLILLNLGVRLAMAAPCGSSSPPPTDPFLHRLRVGTNLSRDYLNMERINPFNDSCGNDPSFPYLCQLVILDQFAQRVQLANANETNTTYVTGLVNKYRTITSQAYSLTLGMENYTSLPEFNDVFKYCYFFRSNETEVMNEIINYL